MSNIGEIALHYAVYYIVPEVTRILSKYKPQLLTDQWNKTALDNARTQRNKEIIELLKQIITCRYLLL